MKNLIIPFLLLIGLTSVAQKTQIVQGAAASTSVALVASTTSALQSITRAGKTTAIVTSTTTGGTFNYSSATLTDNGGTTFAAAGGGHWVRDVSQAGGVLNILWFGADPTGVVDSRAAIQAAIDVCPVGGKVLIPAGTFVISDSLILKNSVALVGLGTSKAIVSVINPMSTFPTGHPLMAMVGNYQVVQGIATDMNYLGGDWVVINGDVGLHNISENNVRHVDSGYAGIHGNDAGGTNGICCMNVSRNYFYQFGTTSPYKRGGSAIYFKGGGDSDNFTDNIFQLINGTYVLFWDGTGGAAKLAFERTNATGASEFIRINYATEFSIINNQFEATVPLTNAHQSIIEVHGMNTGVFANSASVGGTINWNNLNGRNNATVAVYVNSGWNMKVDNNTVLSCPVSVQTTALSKSVIYTRGFEPNTIILDTTKQVTTIYSDSSLFHNKIFFDLPIAQRNGINGQRLEGMRIQNTDTATSGQKQNSGALLWRGAALNTTTGRSMTSDFWAYVSPANGDPITNTLVFESGIGNVTTSTPMTITSSGIIAASTGVANYFSKVGINNHSGITYGARFTAGTPARLDTIEWSPVIGMVGQTWNTTTSSSRTLEYFQYTKPLQDTVDHGQYTFSVIENGGSLRELFGIDNLIGPKSPSGYTMTNSWKLTNTPAQTGNLLLQNHNGTEFGRLIFSMADNTRPALKASGTTLKVVLGDDSGDANFTANDITANRYIVPSTGFIITNSGALNIYHRQDVTNGIIFPYNGITTITSGPRYTTQFSEYFAPTSGDASAFTNRSYFVINQTGGASGITGSYLADPAITAAADYRAYMWLNNSHWGLFGRGTAHNYLKGNLLVGDSVDNNTDKLQVTGSTLLGTGFKVNSTGNIVTLNGATTSFPSSNSAGVLTNNGTGTLTWTAAAATNLTVGSSTISSGTTTKVLYNNAGTLGEYTVSGSGSVALTTSPTFVTPTLGAALATSINGNTITTGTGTLTLSAGKTLAATQTLTFSGTDGTTHTFPSTSSSVARIDAVAQTFAGANTFNGTSSFAGLLIASGSIALNIYHRQDLANGIIFNNNGTTTSTTISRVTGQINENWAPSSGSTTLDILKSAPTINQTGGASGISIGFHMAPVLTAAADWRSFQADNATGYAFYAGAAAKNYFNGLTGIGAAPVTDKLEVTGSIALMSAGNKIKIATGTNASVGTATLVAGTVTVSTTAALTASKIFVTVVTPGGTQGFISVPTIVNATSFSINSTSASETSTVNWWIVN